MDGGWDEVLEHYNSPRLIDVYFLQFKNRPFQAMVYIEQHIHRFIKAVL
jgi:hypothetical protein